MPYKDKELAKEKARERKRKQRGVTPAENVTPLEEMSHPDVTPVHPIIYMLADTEKRLKLRQICKSLKPWMFSEVYVGYPGMGGVSMGQVAELLEAFE